MPEKKPLVSIAMATYNGARFIAEQLQSVLAQTYSEIEVIITDDASSDNTVEIIKALQQKDQRIIYFLQEKNAGVTKTFEHSIKQCSGTYIALADQDDVWEKDKIEKLVAAIGTADVVYSNSLMVDEHNHSMQQEFKSLMNLQSYYSGAPFFMGNSVPGHTMLLKKDFLQKLLPFPEQLMFDRWISFCAAANNGLKYVDECLVRYRQHDSNTVGAGRSKNRKHKKNSQQKFDIKRSELQAYLQADISDEKTKQLLQQMLSTFKRRWSLKRSIFFFRNQSSILVVKRKPRWRKIIFCIKMFFKPAF
jgi:glycosyltransferase involved in cell wall biosynthesis